MTASAPMQVTLKLATSLDGRIALANGQSQWITGPKEYWLLGDNRGYSTDSSLYGPVSQDGVLARIWLRYWPISSWKIF